MTKTHENGAKRPQNGQKAPEMTPEDAELRDIFAGLAPITLLDAIRHSGLCSPGQERDVYLSKPADRAAAMACLAAMRYEYADAMLEARRGTE